MSVESTSTVCMCGGMTHTHTHTLSTILSLFICGCGSTPTTCVYPITDNSQRGLSPVHYSSNTTNTTFPPEFLFKYHTPDITTNIQNIISLQPTEINNNKSGFDWVVTAAATPQGREEISDAMTDCPHCVRAAQRCSTVQSPPRGSIPSSQDVTDLAEQLQSMREARRSFLLDFPCHVFHDFWCF